MNNSVDTNTNPDSNIDKIIPATSKRPEKHSDGKFITATTGKPATPEMGESIKARIYEQKAAQQHNNLPKSMKHITASISYCHHTGTKIAVGTSFKNCPELTKFIRAEHGIFSPLLPLGTAIKIYGRSATTTERYIAMVAVLVKAKIIDTTEMGVILEGQQVEFLRPAFESLLAVLNQCLAFRYTAPIDTLLIDSQNQCAFKRIQTQIKETAQALDSRNFAAGGSKMLPVDSKQSRQIALDDEIELEKELAQILSGYTSLGTDDGTTIKYSKELNRWTRRALNRSDMTDEQITVTMRILNTNPDELRTGTVEAILTTVRESLCYDDEVSRRNSAVVIRHLEYKIELQLACLYQSGFVSEVIAEEVQDDLTATKYLTKTKVIQDKAIEAISRKTSPALARLRKQMGVK